MTYPAVCAHALGAGVVWDLGFADRAQQHALGCRPRLRSRSRSSAQLMLLEAMKPRPSNRRGMLRLSDEQKLAQDARAP